MSYIYLVPIHLHRSVNLEELTRCVENTFGVRTKTRSFKIDLPGTYDLTFRTLHTLNISI
jgi:hypothetical protein